MLLTPGTVLEGGSLIRKAETSWDYLVADDDGLVRETKRFVVGNQIASGDLCDIYECSHQLSGTDGVGVLKVCREQTNHSFMLNEQRALTLNYCTEELLEDFPRLITVLEWEGHKVHLFPYFKGFEPLTSVLRDHPKGVGLKRCLRIYARILEDLGFVHRKGFVHGAILPDHILVQPTTPRLKIIDWCYATEHNHPLPAIPQSSRKFYPPEVLRGEAVTVSTDIYLATRVAVTLLGGNLSSVDMPKNIRELLQESLSDTPEERPLDAWAHCEEIRLTIKRL